MGRYTIQKTTVNDRTCNNSPSGEMEVEKHILMSCEIYVATRQIYIDSCYNKKRIFQYLIMIVILFGWWVMKRPVYTEMFPDFQVGV